MRRHRMPACDIQLTYALEELFESALAAAGRDLCSSCAARGRQAKTVEEENVIPNLVA